MADTLEAGGAEAGDQAGKPERLAAGERRALARAITLAESTRPDHRAATRQLLQRIGQGEIGQGESGAIRIGLSGSPGVGKSTFIEVFGTMLVEQGLKVAVLAVDPSSARSGGSILGDKTRMERLARSPNAFIRPSPSQTERSHTCSGQSNCRIATAMSA